MNVKHEEIDFSLVPNWPPKLEDDCLLIEMRATGEEELVFLKVPRIVANFDAIAQTNYRVDILRSLYWQENTFANLRSKIGDNMTSVGYIFPLSTLSSTRSILQVKVEADQGGEAHFENAAAEEGKVAEPDLNGADFLPQQNDGNKFSNEVTDIARGFGLAAIYNLLKDSSVELVKEVSWGETYSLEEFYPEDLVLAIYTPNRVHATDAEIAHSTIDEYTIKFADLKTYEFHASPLKSYDPNKKFNDEPIIHVSKCKSDRFGPVVQYLRAHLIGIESTESDPLIRFFMQYQFFEMLMHEVFSSVVNDFLGKVQRAPYNENAWKTKGIVGKLNEKAGENFRMKQIFEFIRQNFPAETEILENCCKDILSENIDSASGDNEEDLEEIKLPYYKLRNTVFHGFATSGIAVSDLIPVCEAAGDIIFKLALKFETKGPYFK